MVRTIRPARREQIGTAKRQRDPRTQYSDRPWVKYAAAWVKRYPLCTLCLCRGRINAGATEFAAATQRNLIVDHITPHRGDSELYWDDSNHETLCRYPCHDSDKSRHERRGKDAAAWFAHLSALATEHNAWQQIDTCREWIPPQVWEAIHTTAYYPPEGGGNPGHSWC